jgi:hypothetical protein
MMIKFNGHLLEILIRAFVVVSILGTSVWYFILNVPYEYLDAKVLVPTVTSGENVEIKYTRNKKRICHTYIDQFIERVSDQYVIWRDSIPGGYGPMGISSVIVKLPTRREWGPGEYSYKPQMYQDCGFWKFHIKIPEVKFTLVP